MTVSIATQTEQELGGTGSVLVRQRREHVELDQLMHRCRASRGAEQQRVLAEMSRLVFPHAFAEESVLWPAARRALPDGERITLEIEQEHQRVNDLWSRLEATAPDDPARAPLLEELYTLLEDDVRDEEDVLFPRLQQALAPEALRRLGLAWEVVRRTAPTRPHPVVARRPPGNVLAALPLTLLDRARDQLDRAALAAPAPLAAAGRTASRALATLAGVVEQAPPLRRGEDPSTARRASPEPG